MIVTFTGPMHSGKTEQMISVYNKIWNKKHVMVFKPLCDTRDFCMMKSKTFEIEVPAIGVEKFEDMLEYVTNEVKTVFLDEVQLMKGNVNVLTYLSVVYDIDIYLGGLNMTSEQEPFLVMPYVMAISDQVINVKASCFDCGREATYTYFEGEKSDAVLVGDDGYVPLCRKCLLERNGRKVLKKKLSIEDVDNKKKETNLGE